MRLDLYLVEVKRFPSRQRAQREIRAGNVTVNGKRITKPSHDIAASDRVAVHATTNPYVSQGGLKLEHAIRHFSLDLEGRRVLDIGSSTGGFTDCALRHGAKNVYAVDVGTLQMHGTLREDDRVILHEQTNFLDIGPDDLGGPIDLVVVDVSFTSSLPIIRHAYGMLDAPEMVVLVKPQFETRKRNRRGIVNRPDHHRSILKSHILSLKSQDIPVHALIPSPVKGSHGNIEFLLHIRKPTKPIDVDAVVDAAWRRD
ncbi:MAG: TlyA family RNA methyltransferase [Bacillota bacterium]